MEESKFEALFKSFNESVAASEILDNKAGQCRCGRPRPRRRRRRF